MEFLLLIKSSRDLFEAVHAELGKLHSYELPEVIVLPVVAGSEGYLAWIGQELRVP
jgi:periplasmic divalent cation tolerance protein